MYSARRNEVSRTGLIVNGGVVSVDGVRIWGGRERFVLLTKAFRGRLPDRPENSNSLRRFVPEVGLEPTHLSILHFECNASTNSAIRARHLSYFTQL